MYNFIVQFYWDYILLSKTYNFITDCIHKSRWYWRTLYHSVNSSWLLAADMGFGCCLHCNQIFHVPAMISQVFLGSKCWYRPMKHEWGRGLVVICQNQSLMMSLWWWTGPTRSLKLVVSNIISICDCFTRQDWYQLACSNFVLMTKLWSVLFDVYFYHKHIIHNMNYITFSKCQPLVRPYQILGFKGLSCVTYYAYANRLA